MTMPCGRIPLGLAALGFALFSASLVAGQTLQDRERALIAAQRLAARAAKQADRLDEQADAEGAAASAAQVKAAALAARVQASEAAIIAAEARLLVVRKRTEDVRARLAERQRPMIRLVAALQMLGRRPPGLALAQPGSAADMVHVRMVLAALAPELRRRTAGLRQMLDEKRQLESDLQAQFMQLAQKRTQLAQERLALVRLEAEHRAASARLSQSAMSEQDRAIAMGEEARDIADLIGQMGVQATRQAALASLSGPVLRPTFPGLMPLPAPETALRYRLSRLSFRLPAAGLLVTGFGEIEESGARSRGLTLRTQPGAQVVAPASGRVVFAGPFRGYDQIAIMDHGGGWTSLVTNLEKLDIRVGQQLISGSPIGQMGMREPQIMVELRYQGHPVDITGFVT